MACTCIAHGRGTSAPTAMVPVMRRGRLGEATWQYMEHSKRPRDLESGFPKAKVALEGAKVGITGVYWTLQEAEGGMTRGMACQL